MSPDLLKGMAPSVRYEVDATTKKHPSVSLRGVPSFYGNGGRAARGGGGDDDDDTGAGSGHEGTDGDGVGDVRAQPQHEGRAPPFEDDRPGRVLQLLKEAKDRRRPVSPSDVC